MDNKKKQDYLIMVGELAQWEKELAMYHMSDVSEEEAEIYGRVHTAIMLKCACNFGSDADEKYRDTSFEMFYEERKRLHNLIAKIGKKKETQNRKEALI